MAIGSILGAVAGSVASAGASALAGKFLGGSKKAPKGSVKNGQIPPGFDAGGLRARFGNEGYTVTSNAERSGFVDEISRTFPEQASNIRNLRMSVAPGASELRRVRLQQIEDARRSAVGNLRENLDRRRVLGSSFGQDAVTRAEAEFAAVKERSEAETFLQELELTNSLINQEFEVSRGQFTTKLDELNLQAEIATKLSTQASSQLGELAKMKAEIAYKESAGAGQFVGELIKPIGNAIGSGVSNFFSSPSYSGSIAP